MGRLGRGGGCRCRSQIECDPEPGLPARGLPVGPTDPGGGNCSNRTLAPLRLFDFPVVSKTFLGGVLLLFVPRLVVFLDFSMVCLHCFDENEPGDDHRR